MIYGKVDFLSYISQNEIEDLHDIRSISAVCFSIQFM
ncbi:unnamed protein product, partial [Larinioides sclopetarius]